MNPARLREMADAMQSAIDHAFDPRRLANTPKRARQAGEARIEGRRLQRTQIALRRLADLHEAGDCPTIFRGISKAGAYDLLGADIERNGGYYDHGTDLNRQRSDASTEAKALWALVTAEGSADMAAERLRAKLEALKFAKIPGYFPTPAALCARMVELAELPAGDFAMLEPSAGHGAIADAVKAAAGGRACIRTVEINHTLREILTAKGHFVAPSCDFTAIPPAPGYDRILMNPPFENGQDAKHTMHAWNFLKPKGILVSILAGNALQRRDTTFAKWFDDVNAERYPIPAGAFKESGTDVASVIVLAVKQ